MKKISTLTTFLIIRPISIILVQGFLWVLLKNWNDTFIWWPFQMIISNFICFCVMFWLVKRDKQKLTAIYFHPFDKGMNIGGFTKYLQSSKQRERLKSFLMDISIFLIILATFGILALKMMSVISLSIQSNVEFSRYGVLPLWATISITILLPVTMPLVEIPWYFGYFFPKLETSFKHKSFIKAFTITTIVFSLQHCFQPFYFDSLFLALRSIMLLPVIILVGLVIRIIPRLTPYILIFHLLMAVEVVVKYWNLY